MFVYERKRKLIVQAQSTKSTCGLIHFPIVRLRYVCFFPYDEAIVSFYILESTLFLGQAVERWIKHHFFRAKRAKCFVLIGPSGAGKTSFALSLPGRVNYFQGFWNLDKWSDYARYSVYDDIPWDEFEKFGYPPKKGLLTQNGELGVSTHG